MGWDRELPLGSGFIQDEEGRDSWKTQGIFSWPSRALVTHETLTPSSFPQARRRDGLEQQLQLGLGGFIRDQHGENTPGTPCR